MEASELLCEITQEAPMADERIKSAVIDRDNPPSSPSGSTDQKQERVKKFDEEGGDQPQAASQRAVDEELERARRDA